MILRDQHVIATASHKIKPLIVSETPFPGESLLGLVSRNLANTSVMRIAPGLAMAGIGVHRPEPLPGLLDDPGQISDLAKLLGLSADEVRKRLHLRKGGISRNGATISFQGADIRKYYREGTIRRVSPLALRRTSFHRAIWSIRPFAFDPETLEPLIKSCPVCGCELGWFRVSKPHVCEHCVDENFRHTTDLREFAGAPVLTDDLAALTLAPRLLSHDPTVAAEARGSLPAPWVELSLGDLFETIMELCFALSGGEDKRKDTVRRPAPSSLSNLAPEVLQRVSRMLLQGTDALDELLEEARAKREDRSGHFGKYVEFGHLTYLSRDKYFPSKAKTIVGAAIERVLSRDPMERRLKRQVESDKRVDMSEAARTTGLPLSTIVSLGAVGAIDVRRGGLRGIERMVDCTEVQAAYADLRDVITDFEVGRRLGVDVYHLEYLEAAGLIGTPRAVLQPALPAGKRYTSTSVNRLLHRVYALVEPETGDIAIKSALEILRIGHVPWAAVLLVVATTPGLVSLRTDASGDWRNCVFVRDVGQLRRSIEQAIAGLPPASETISTAEAALILRSNIHFVGRCVKLGALVKLQGSNGRFDLKHVQRFARDHIYGRELAEHYGLSATNRLRSALADLGVTEAFPTERRDLIYRRDQLPAELQSRNPVNTLSESGA